jgi:hypothetical protein
MATTNLHIPFPRPTLMGREEDLQRLHDALRQGDTAITPALTGQGGVGKTQLAVLYAYTYADVYPEGIFWLNAADPHTILPQLADYATVLGLPQLTTGGDQAEYLRQRALQWVSAVSQRGDALAILDNLDDEALLRNELPSLPNVRLLGLGCRVLITSRRRALPGCTDLPLDILTPEAARTLLLRERGALPRVRPSKRRWKRSARCWAASHWQCAWRASYSNVVPRVYGILRPCCASTGLYRSWITASCD